jgi:methionyl-tRNA formyltransferase
MVHVHVLSSYPEHILSTLERFGDSYTVSEDTAFDFSQAEFIICYGHRHLVREPILSRFQDRIINLHISMLPWNRGADPNFWSWYDDTPKGVSIHHVDWGLDTGDLIAQEAVDFSDYPDETLFTSYHRLRCAVEILFRNKWNDIRTGNTSRIKQTHEGSYHRAADKMAIWPLLKLGYDTAVREVTALGRESR